MRFVNRIARPAAAVLCLACALGVSAAADSRWVLITILHTNDLHGNVLPRDSAGGLARAATLVRRIRADMPNVVLMDAGDIIHGSPEDYLGGHLATVCAMNAAGYDVAAAGNHEFDFGLPTLERVTAKAGFPVVAANVRAAGGDDWNGVKRYVVLNVDNVRVGVIGLTTLDTISLEWPGSIRDIRIQDPIETARALVPEVAALSDVVVVLSHLGLEQDRALARNVPGIDFIVGGHSHTAIEDWEWCGGTLITQTGAYGRALGRIDFIVRRTENGARIWSVNGGRRRWNDLPRPPLWKSYPDSPLLPVSEDVTADESVCTAYAPFRKKADAYLSGVIGWSPAGVAGRVVGADESASADLLADAVRHFARSDIALVDADAIDGRGFPAGNVTIRSAFDLIGGYTRQQIVVGRMSGEDLIRALDAEFNRKKGINLAVSGGAVEYSVVDGVFRVRSFVVGGGPADAKSRYTVAAQAYVMMNLMQAVPGAVTITAEHSQTTREALVDYLRARRIIEPPEVGRVRRTE